MKGAVYDAPDPEFPQSWNEYSYANNTPLALIDPLGLAVCRPTAKLHLPNDDKNATASGPYEPQGGEEAGEQAADPPGYSGCAGGGGWIMIDGVEVPEGLGLGLESFGGGPLGGGSESGQWAFTSSENGAQYTVQPGPGGSGSCYTARNGEPVCRPIDWAELGLPDPNEIIGAAMVADSAPLLNGTGPAAGGFGGASPAGSWFSTAKADVRTAVHWYCGANPSVPILRSIRNAGIVGAVAGGVVGFGGGELLGGEVSAGLTGVPGAAFGVLLGGAVGAIKGSFFGLESAAACGAFGLYN